MIGSYEICIIFGIGIGTIFSCYMSPKLHNLFRSWFLPFCKDFIFFYAIFSLGFIAFLRCVDPINPLHRALCGCGVVFLWSWFWIGFYNCLYREPFLKFLISHGENAEKMRDKYALPPNWTEPLSFAQQAPNVLRNQMVYFGLAILSWQILGSFTEAASAEPWWLVLCNVLVMMLCFDALIYVNHYILHSFLWPYHRDHHRTKAVSPSSGWYMHIVDLMMELWFPIFLPSFILRCGWQSMITWLLLVEWDGVHTHSGFDFWPGVIPGPTRHWLHHLLYYCNYSLGLWDEIFGTEAREKVRGIGDDFPPQPLLSFVAEHNSSRFMRSNTLGLLQLDGYKGYVEDGYAPLGPLDDRRVLARMITTGSDIFDRHCSFMGAEDIGAIDPARLEAHLSSLSYSLAEDEK